MKFDFRMPILVLVLAVFCFFIPILSDLHVPLMGGATVTAVESLQALLLLGFAVFSYIYIRPYSLTKGQKIFWLWSVAWWIVLFGRSISWGRDYFPDVPKVYFRTISVFVIAPVVFMLFSSTLRKEIAYKFKNALLPFWAVLLSVAGLILSDTIEHGRFFSVFLLHDLNYKDLIEEFYEFPLIVGLFLVAWPIMRADCLGMETAQASTEIQAADSNLSP